MTWHLLGHYSTYISAPYLLQDYYLSFRSRHKAMRIRASVTELTNYTKLSKKITCQSRRFSKLKPV
jgi:hypothetical protein